MMMSLKKRKLKFKPRIKQKKKHHLHTLLICSWLIMSHELLIYFDFYLNRIPDVTLLVKP